MAAEGWAIVDVKSADDCPDGIFIEDAVVLFGDLAVLCRPGAPSRRAEVAGARAAVTARADAFAKVHVYALLGLSTASNLLRLKRARSVSGSDGKPTGEDCSTRNPREQQARSSQDNAMTDLGMVAVASLLAAGSE